MNLTHRMKRIVAGATLVLAPLAIASNHRESPITALDPKADITDLYAFVSYDEDTEVGETPEKVTIILCVDPFLEPGNGPNWAPFDPDLLYEIKVDNNQDALADLTFQFRFNTEFRLPDVFTVYAGFGDNGAVDPETGALVIPPQIRDFQSPGLGARQSYTVSIRRGGERRPRFFDFRNRGGNAMQVRNENGEPLYAVPVNVGPRTLDYEALFDAGTYTSLDMDGMSVFAGSVDDPFFLDLGAAFDTANFRTLETGIPGVLSANEEASARNFASDTFSGFAVNAIAIEVPIEMLTSTGELEPASSPAASIGVWATTSRPRITVRRAPQDAVSFGARTSQVQRFGNPLINELIIGTGFKNRFSMEQPVNDSQFARFFLDPPIAQVVEALYNSLAPGALDVPEADRVDLLPLVQYMPPNAPEGTDPGPIADLMRLNTGVPATPPDDANPLGVIGQDPAGMPNGRRLFDDSFDIILRAGVGGVFIPEFNVFPNNVLGDGVNVNDVPFRNEFPYLGSSPSGRNRRHIDPGERFPAPFDNEIVPVN